MLAPDVLPLPNGLFLYTREDDDRSTILYPAAVVITIGAVKDRQIQHYREEAIRARAELVSGRVNLERAYELVAKRCEELEGQLAAAQAVAEEARAAAAGPRKRGRKPGQQVSKTSRR